MKIVIDIPEEDYIRLRDEGMFGNVTTFKRAVREGTPLPKGLIPITDVMSVFDDYMCGDVDEDGMDIFYEMLKEKVVNTDADSN